MDSDKILQVVRRYRRRFLEIDGLKKIDYPREDLLPIYPRIYALSHCFGMLSKIEDFVNEGKIEKAFRWLGFIQGVLWVLRIYKLEDLKKHNSPAP